MEWVGFNKAFPQTHSSPQPTSHSVLQVQVLQQGMTGLLLDPGDGQGLESRFP